MKRELIAGAFVLALAASACGSSDDAGGNTSTPDTATSDSTATSDATASSEMADSACDTVPVKTEGQLTVATGEPVFPPWMGAGEDDFDDPSTGTGYEGALVYDLADQLGFTRDQVVWVRTGFDEVIAAGAKDWDFNIQQFSITPEREQVVDFSEGYYTVQQAIIGAADSPAAGASSIADLKDVRIGAALGTTSLDYAENVIAPSSQVQVFDDNAAAKAAFDAGQVDAIVFDLPTAYYITAVEITDASIIGILPDAGENPDELGMLFEKGSELVPCVNHALETLRSDGTLDALRDEWLSQGGDIPTLTN